MRKLFPFIALLLVYAFTPGMCELVEVSVHFAATGDVHSSDAERHSDHGEPHSEGSECHTCFCHAPTAFPMVVALSGDTLAVSSDNQNTFVLANVTDDDSIRQLFRPPIS